jgi:N-ethylmaleimide reductase
MNPLVSPITAGALDAPNRVWMAPLTRSRARMPGNIPWEMNAEYYAQRADPRTGAGVIISEATPVSPRGHGYYATPGIHTREQAEGWRLVTDAVHERGGLIVCQLWHVGRVSHSALQPNNERPVGPTDARSMSKTYLDHTMERVDNSEPRALLDEEVPGVVEEFRSATALARDAGFDGVEIHGANTYLLDQFTRDGMNTRTDRWGGSLENRLRFPTMVAEAVAEEIGADRVGYRISPLSEHHDARDSDPGETFSALARRLGSMGLAFLHAVETWDRPNLDPRTADVIPRVRDAFKDAGGGVYVGNGDYTPEQAAAAIDEGWCDAVAFGRLFIPNPDLTERIRRGGPFREPDRETFYGGGPEGYTEFTPLDDADA